MRLQEIVNMMQGLEESGDHESAHSDADDLLEDALVFLAERVGDPEIITLTQELLASYDNIYKWYA